MRLGDKDERKVGAVVIWPRPVSVDVMTHPTRRTVQSCSLLHTREVKAINNCLYSKRTVDHYDLGSCSCRGK